jgi:predicted ATP-grasp superfamily ATP-dependent carboligase
VCQRLLTAAKELKVTRVCCFAAWAADRKPADASRVHGVATDEAGLRDLRAHGAEVVAEGRISGLNGVLLAAAAEQGLHGVGLLGEMPALALHLAYPTASAAVLRSFGALAGIPLDLEELERYGRRMQEQLSDAYQQALKAMGDAGPERPEERESPRPAPEPEEESSEDVRRIEELFALATKDRAKAFELKTELDRLGLFRQYEDRFLGLFKEK